MPGYTMAAPVPLSGKIKVTIRPLILMTPCLHILNLFYNYFGENLISLLTKVLFWTNLKNTMTL